MFNYTEMENDLARETDIALALEAQSRTPQATNDKMVEALRKMLDQIAPAERQLRATFEAQINALETDTELEVSRLRNTAVSILAQIDTLTKALDQTNGQIESVENANGAKQEALEVRLNSDIAQLRQRRAALEAALGEMASPAGGGL